MVLGHFLVMLRIFLIRKFSLVQHNVVFASHLWGESRLSLGECDFIAEFVWLSVFFFTEGCVPFFWQNSCGLKFFFYRGLRAVFLAEFIGVFCGAEVAKERVITFSFIYIFLDIFIMMFFL